MAIVQFSHANGFPAGSYRTFFAALELHCAVRAVEYIGMDPRYPVTPSWPHLVTQLVEAIEACGEPPILVGHSLGGILSTLAAYRVPQRVRAVIVIDAPIMSRLHGMAFAALKMLRLDDRLSPAGQTQNRRERWASRDEARAHFASRPLFAEFDPRALDDYVAAGLIDVAGDAGGAVRLAIDRAVETRIYRTIPHDLHRITARPKPVPFGFLAGTRSRELAQIGVMTSRRFYGSYFRWFEGGHLLPMERPVSAAEQILALLRAMGVGDLPGAVDHCAREVLAAAGSATPFRSPA